MPRFKSGNVLSSPKSPNTTPNQEVLSQIKDYKSQIISARVLDIVLDENHPKFKSVGEWNGIGTIFYEISNNVGSSGDLIAKPYNPQSKTYPLINEMVLLFDLPNQNIGSNTSNSSFYYFNPISIWNHPHHDAYPNLQKTSILPANQKQDYQQIEGGSARRITDESTEINLNSPTNSSQNTFVEKTNIHPLMPFMGDVLHEGRHGQSMRFGSTSKSQSQNKNNWSTSGLNGDPITILRNGQPNNSNDEGWVPILEDIKEDLSSIYLTSYQKIPLSLSNENFKSYHTPPTTPSQYTQPQLIFNSDRIILNSKSNDILLSAFKSTYISSLESVNIESKQIIIDSTDIKLGSKTASQPVLKGNDTVTLIMQLTTEVRNISKTLETIKAYPNGVPTPDATINAISQISTKNLNKILDILNDDVNGIKSNFVKTI